MTDDENLFTVIDLETTGVSSNDRIVEIALVQIDVDGVVVDVFESLINPERDVGPTGIHGISASMVSAAPTFEDVAGLVAKRIDGRILAAHNLPFDSRILASEFQRLGLVFDYGQGICTLSHTGSRLEVACSEYGVTHEETHHALGDALATAGLLMECGALSDDAPLRRAQTSGPAVSEPVRTLTRKAFEKGTGRSPLVGSANLAKLPVGNSPVLVYSEALDRALLDATVSSEEELALRELAAEFGLTASDLTEIHTLYFQNLLAAVERDGVVTSEEHELLVRVRDALAIDSAIPEPSAARSPEVEVSPGMKVCFTGEAIDSSGQVIPRSALEAHARSIGLECVNNVTKKNCDLLVASDSASMSGKAKKARQYGKPVISADEFVSLSG